MKILIVDDEVFVRIGIKTTCEWSSYGYEIVGEAEDGVEGVEYFNKYRPDIVLVDIMMPRMNGLDFIKQVKDINPACRFIVLSCHNEFEYVREAMKLGVRDYIIKTTIKRDELLEIVNRVADEIRAECSKIDALSEEKRENWINRPIIIKEYLNGLLDKIEPNENKILAKIQELQLELSVPDMHILLISVDHIANLKREYEPRYYELMIFGITNIAQEIIKRTANAVTFKRNDREVVCVISFPADSIKAEIMYELHVMANDIIKSIKEFLNVDISIGISNDASHFTEIGDIYNQASTLLERRFFSGPTSIITYKDPMEKSTVFTDAFQKFEVEMISHFQAFNFEQAVLLLDEFKNSPILKFGDDAELVKKVILDMMLNLFKILKDELLKKEQPAYKSFNPAQVLNAMYLQEILEYMDYILHEVGSMVDERFNHQNINIISKIKDYVQQNEGAEITLNEAAEYVNLSPGYFSRLFKKLTGENFSEYVIKFKVEKAKNLIREGEKLWTITQRLGYTEISSFSRIFKKIEGLSPQQYKMKFTTKYNEVKKCPPPR
jgi:Response regulator containing CheY-like receiver domain and AraC-type DNA-binding domain